MKANMFKVIVMAIAICTAASNTTLAQGRHNSARIENHQGPRHDARPGDNHGPKHDKAPRMHDRHHGPNAHMAPGHGMAPRMHRAPRVHYAPRHHYVPVRHPRPLPPYVRYRAYDIAPTIGSILTELPLRAVEVLIDDVSYYSAMGLLFRPFYIDNVMHFEVMNPF